MNARPAPRASRLAAAIGAPAALWLLLAGADPRAWVVGAPAVVLAAWCALALPSPGVRVRGGALVRLGAVFVRDSLRGAIDVGARALARDPGLRPRVVEWRTALRSPAARLVLAHAVSLVPGTLTARVDGEVLHFHLLDDRVPWRAEIAALEARIAAALEPDAREPEPSR